MKAKSALLFYGALFIVFAFAPAFRTHYAWAAVVVVLLFLVVVIVVVLYLL